MVLERATLDRGRDIYHLFMTQRRCFQLAIDNKSALPSDETIGSVGIQFVYRVGLHVSFTLIGPSMGHPTVRLVQSAQYEDS